VTLNLTSVQYGVSGDVGKTYNLNVVPSAAEAGFDIRIPPHVDLVEFENKIKSWTNECDVSYEFIVKTSKNVVSSIDPKKNIYFAAFNSACQKLGIECENEIFPAATDGRYLRSHLDIPVYGFSPMNKTPILLHDHNEHISVNTFLKGIHIYVEIITTIANCS